MLINQFILPLEQNEIWEINSDDLFCDLPSLMDLHLGKSRNSRNNPPPLVELSIIVLFMFKYLCTCLSCLQHS